MQALFNHMSSKWYPEGYTYPTMHIPTYARCGANGSTSSLAETPCKSLSAPDLKPQKASIQTPTDSSSKRSYATPDGIKARMYSTTRRHSEPDLVDGVNYFKVHCSLPLRSLHITHIRLYLQIGEIVRVRRYFTRTDDYSAWLPGKVVRPIFTSHDSEVLPPPPLLCVTNCCPSD